MNDETRIDINQTRTFKIDGFLNRQWPFALGLVVLGGIMLAILDTDSSGRHELLISAIILIVAGLGYFVFLLQRNARASKPALVLSQDGILTRMGMTKSVLIPWSEIQDLDTMDIDRNVWTLSGMRTVSFPDVTVALISKRFYDANIHVNSLFMRGPFWSYYFMPAGDKVQVTFLHEYLSISADELRAEIEARWRAFNARAKAKPPFVPREKSPVFNQLPLWLKKLLVTTTSGAAKVLMALIVMAFIAFAAFYWRYPMAWMQMPDLPEGSRSVYLRDLLDGKGVSTRLANGQMTLLRRADVKEIGASNCINNVARVSDPSIRFGAAYKVSGYCTFKLTTASGEGATAIFRTFLKSYETVTWLMPENTPKKQTRWAVAAESVDLDVARDQLCAMGECGAQ